MCIRDRVICALFNTLETLALAIILSLLIVNFSLSISKLRSCQLAWFASTTKSKFISSIGNLKPGYCTCPFSIDVFKSILGNLLIVELYMPFIVPPKLLIPSEVILLKSLLYSLGIKDKIELTLLFGASTVRSNWISSSCKIMSPTKDKSKSLSLIKFSLNEYLFSVSYTHLTLPTTPYV